MSKAVSKKRQSLSRSTDALAEILVKKATTDKEMDTDMQLVIMDRLIKWNAIRNKIGSLDDDDTSGGGHAFNTYRKEIEAAGSGVGEPAAKPKSATPLADLSRYTPRLVEPEPDDDEAGAGPH